MEEKTEGALVKSPMDAKKEIDESDTTRLGSKSDHKRNVDKKNPHCNMSEGNNGSLDSFVFRETARERKTEIETKPEG